MKRRFYLFSLAVVLCFSVNAQLGYMPMRTSPSYYGVDSLGIAEKKWRLQPYAGFSTSFMAFNGGSATVFSAPLGLQMTRQLNSNLYAFAGVYAAPTYVNFNRDFMNLQPGKFNPANMSINPGIEGGLMYINDQRTFSISGSIRMERNSYLHYPYYNPNNNNNKIAR